MRRKRKSKYTWFPIIGAADTAEGGNDDFNGRAFSLNLAPNGGTSIIIFPLVPDAQVEADSINPNDPGQLVQFIGQDYVIERIVGKCFIGAQGPEDDPGPPEVIFPKVVQVGVGLFVARQADNNTGGGPNIPIGSASAQEAVENFSPLNNDNVREPWMWRRDWLLTTGRQGADTLGATTAFQNFFSGTISGQSMCPTANTSCGSVLDGPHIDVKSVRRVRKDERLWCVAAARTMDVLLGIRIPTTIIDGGVKGYITLRVLGQLRKAFNRSNF